MDFMSNAGLYIAVIGASLAVALACAGSGKGVKPLPASSLRTPVSSLPA